MRGNVDKAAYTEGVYGNSRFTHVVTSLVGSNVEVQVKNGNKYEGVFRTFSPKMEIVLECVHRVEDNTTTPSRDSILEKVIFHIQDVLMVSALNVDLEFAFRDSFTDEAISRKLNGQISEKELQPWESDYDHEGSLGSIEGDSSASNGWDAREMFRTNAEQFNVHSTYDSSLHQYTTPLDRSDSAEYKQREAEARRLAMEIEGSDVYKQRIALENGDGDEEERFSAVIRPNESTGNRYVPPHRRSGGTQGGSRRAGPSQSPQKPQTPTEETQPKLNGDKEETKKPSAVVESNSNSNRSSNEVVQSPPAAPQVTSASKEEIGTQNLARERPLVPKPEWVSKQQSPTVPVKAREEQIAELKQFGANFKLDDSKNKEAKEKPHAQETEQKHAEKLSVEETKPPDTSENKENEKVTEVVKTSKLNPNAKEFSLNPNAKSFVPKMPLSGAPTPPRPQSQSPLIAQTPMQQTQPTVYQMFMPGPGVTMTPVPQNPGQPRYPRKAATVSVQQGPRAEYNSQVIAANAVTGQPLLAQAAPTQTPQLVQYMHMPGTVMQQAMPGNPYPQQQMFLNGGAARMMAPQQVMAGNVPSSQGQGSTDHHQSHPVYGAQAMPAHMAHPGAQQHPHPSPAHMAPHHQPTPPHSAGAGIMGPQPGANHPAPSPVHHQQQPVHAHPGGHPPNAGTPQPAMVYQATAGPQMGQQHPPLQPSPHTPTSPQAVHPVSFPYTFSSQPVNIQQGATPYTSFAHTHSYTTATNAHQYQQQQHNIHNATAQSQPQLVMMPHTTHNPQYQQGAPPQMTGQPQQVGQFQAAPAHMQGPTHMQATQMPGHMVPHSGVAAVGNMSANANVQQVHYIHSQVPTQVQYQQHQ